MKGKRVRVVTTSAVNEPVKKDTPRVITSATNPSIPRLTDKEVQARLQKRYATTTTFGGMRHAGDTMDSGTSQFYSPQLSTDFLEKPQNLRERRAFYRFFYNSNEIVAQAIDIHSTLPLSKLRLVPPKGKNSHQNKYIMKFFESMCDNMKLFKTLIEVSHEYMLYGNCLHKDALVKVIGGYKSASEISMGDMVLTNQGRYRKVVHRFVRPSENIIRIKCWKNFKDLPVTDEHPIEVFRDNKFIFEQAENLSTSDYIRVTWPTEVEDRDFALFDFTEDYKKVGDGYELSFKIPHNRMPEGLKARKGLLTWLNSLTEPVIRTRQQLADDFGVSLNTLHTVITGLNQELGTNFHERIGGSGWQKGSQVKWLPIKVDAEVTESYLINRVKFIKAIDKVEIDNDLIYLAGFWLGDGTLARDNSRDTWGRGLWQI